jgi:hypothetical protein
MRTTYFMVCSTAAGFRNQQKYKTAVRRTTEYAHRLVIRKVYCAESASLLF